MPNIYEQPDWDDLQVRAKQRMAQVDAMPADVRDLIHEFNVNAVVAAFQKGCATVTEIRSFLLAQQRRAQPSI